MFDYAYNNCNILLEKNQYKILGRVERDKATLRLSALVSVQIPDGRVSEEVVVQSSRLQERGTGELKWLKDYSETFTNNDLEIVKKEVHKILADVPKEVIETSDKLMPSEVFGRLTEFIIEHCELISPDGETVMKPPALIKDGYGYVRTTEFESFISLNKDMGWKRLEVLKMLKRNGLLQTGKERTYDKKIKVNGHSANYYVVRLSNDKKGNLITEDEPDETIEIEIKKGEKNNDN